MMPVVCTCLWWAVTETVYKVLYVSSSIMTACECINLGVVDLMQIE